MPLSMRDLESLLVFALKDHFKLLLFSAAVVSFLIINVEGFQVICIPGIEDFLVSS